MSLETNAPKLEEIQVLEPEKKQEIRDIAIEAKQAVAQDKGYELFWKFIDRREQLKREWGEVTEEDIKGTEVEGVTPVRDVENPMGEDLSGNVNMFFVSDQHWSTELGESVRQQTLEGYELLRKGERLGYKVLEFANALKEAIALFPNAYCDLRDAYASKSDEEIKKVQEKYKDKLPPEAFKAINNPLAILRFEYIKYQFSNDRTVRTRVEKALELDGEDHSKGIDEWMKKGQWRTRNDLIPDLVKEMVQANIQDIPEGSTVMMIDGGDPAQDGGVKADHLGNRKFLGELVRDIPGNIKRFVAKLWGNHEEDAREAHVLPELVKLYGPQVFYQEIKGSSPDKNVLVAGVNSFILENEFWNNVMRDVLGNKYDEEEARKILESMVTLVEAQKAVLEKMKGFEGKVVVLDHYAGRFEKYMLSEAGNKLQDVNITNIISGHTHHNASYTVKYGKKGEESAMKVDTASSYIGISPFGVNAPEGLRVDINDGDVTIRRMKVDKKALSKRLGVPVS